MSDTLERIRTPFGGVIRRVFYIECGRCGKNLRSYAKTKQQVERDLREGGWRVTVQGWTCPDCLAPARQQDDGEKGGEG